MSNILEGCRGIILIALPAPSHDKARIPHIQAAVRCYPNHVFLGAAPRYDGSDQAHFEHCAHLAHATAAPMVALGDVLMHHGSRRQLADVLTCMPNAVSPGSRALKTPAFPKATPPLLPCGPMFPHG